MSQAVALAVFTHDLHECYLYLSGQHHVSESGGWI